MARTRGDGSTVEAGSGNHRALEILGLAALGHGLNWLPIQLGLGVEMLAGLVFPYLALLLYGTRPALWVALITLLPVMFLWGSAVSPALIFLEIAIVAGLMPRTKLSTSTLILIFWFAVGGPMTLLLHQALYDISLPTSATMAAKQLANSSLAAAAAALLAAYVPALRKRLVGASRRRVRSLQHFFANVMTISFFLPLSVFAAFLFNQSRSGMERQADIWLSLALQTAQAQIRTGTDAGADDLSGQLDKLALPPMTRVIILDAHGNILQPLDESGAARVEDQLALAQRGLTHLGPEKPKIKAIDRHLNQDRVLIRPGAQGPGLLLAAVLDPADLIAAMRQERRRYISLISGMFLLGHLVAFWVLRAIRRETAPYASALLALDTQEFRPPMRAPLLLETGSLWKRIRRLQKRIRSSQMGLQQASERLIRMIEDAPLIIWSARSVQGRLSSNFMSPSANLIPGPNRDRCAAEWLDQVHPDDRESVAILPDLALANGGANLEYRILSPGRDELWVMELITCLDAGQDKESGAELVGILIDITHLKRAHQRRMRDARLITLGEMSTGMAHELNQPLQVIRLSAENALAAMQSSAHGMPALNDYLSEKFTRIDEQAQRAADIIQRMRIFSRPETGQALEHITICELIQRALFNFRQQLQSHNIRVSVEFSDECLVVGSHQRRLEQVLINLVINSRDAILRQRARLHDPGYAGRIDIRTHALSSDQQRQVLIRVSDNGGGVEEHLLDTLFEPFYTDKPGGHGPGLGLTLAWGLLMEMGGSIEARNEADGLRIDLMIPLVPPGEGDCPVHGKPLPENPHD